MPADQRLDRKAARARCDAATPGPWASKAPMFGERWVGVHQNPTDWDGMGFQAIASVLAHDHVTHNADFIAHARADLPAALDALDERDALLRKCRHHLVEHDLDYHHTTPAELLDAIDTLLVEVPRG